MAKRDDNEEFTVYHIPANYIESGRILNGMFKTRNAIEAVIAVLLGLTVLSIFPFTSQAGIITKVAILGPIGMLFLIGVNDGPASTFLFSLLHWFFKKDILKYNENAEPLKGTALDVYENRQAPGEKLMQKVREWREKRAAQQIADDSDYSFEKDPFVADINTFFDRERRETPSVETQIENEMVPATTAKDQVGPADAALDIDEMGTLGDDFFG